LVEFFVIVLVLMIAGVILVGVGKESEQMPPGSVERTAAQVQPMCSPVVFDASAETSVVVRRGAVVG